MIKSKTEVKGNTIITHYYPTFNRLKFYRKKLFKAEMEKRELRLKFWRCCRCRVETRLVSKSTYFCSEGSLCEKCYEKNLNN
jgi:hypothetical protein